MRAEFYIPIPPTANNLYANRAGGRYKTPKYEAWRSSAVVAILEQAAPCFSGNVAVELDVPRKRRNSDIDNRMKATLDAMVAAGVLRDDSDVIQITTRWIDKGNEKARVNVRSA